MNKKGVCVDAATSLDVKNNPDPMIPPTSNSTASHNDMPRSSVAFPVVPVAVITVAGTVALVESMRLLQGIEPWRIPSTEFQSPLSPPPSTDGVQEPAAPRVSIETESVEIPSLIRE